MTVKELSPSALTTEQLRLESERLRLITLEMLTRAGSGHPGGSFSIAELTSVLYFGGALRYDPADPRWDLRDRLVLSKGHCIPIIYAAMTEAGFFPADELQKLRRIPGCLTQGHATMTTPGIDFSTGALGQGLSAGVGMAIGARLKGRDLHTWVIIGDGEMQEGQVKEAAEHAGIEKLSNLTAIVDVNQAQQSAGTRERTGIDYTGFWKSLGWNVVELDGVSADPVRNKTYIEALQKALLTARSAGRTPQAPTVILLKTIKGKGVSFMEYTGKGEHPWHGRAPSQAEADKARPEIEARLGALPNDWAATLLATRITPQIKNTVEETNRAAEAAAAPRLHRTASVPEFSWSADKGVSTRQAFGEALATLGASEPRLIATSPDTQNSVYLVTFEKHHGLFSPQDPQGRYIGMGIAEAHAVGVCEGLSTFGFLPVIATFDAFLLQASHVVAHAVQNHLPIVIAATHSGSAIGEDGRSQMGVFTHGTYERFSGPDGEALAMYEPADGPEATATAKVIVEDFKQGKLKGPVYVRLTRQAIPNLTASSPTDIRAGISILKSAKSPKAILVAAGTTAQEALKASTALESDGIPVTVVNAIGMNRLHLKNGRFVQEILLPGIPVFTFHDGDAKALQDAVLRAQNTRRALFPNEIQGLVVAIGTDSDRMTSAATKDILALQGLDAEGMVRVVRQNVKK